MISLEQFVDRVYADPNCGCWLWDGYVHPNYGYGGILIHKRYYRAHRLSWTLHCGTIPDGMLVCHHCDVRRCVNPDHLFLGSHDDNMADMVRKNRAARGEVSGRSKLTKEQVVAIQQDTRLYRVIAKDYGISKRHIIDIRAGKTWRHLLDKKSSLRGSGSHNREKTHCPQGHPYSDENLCMRRDGARTCRTCTRERNKQYKIRTKESSRRAEMNFK